MKLAYLSGCLALLMVTTAMAEETSLGVLAQRFNTRIEWDAKAGRVTKHPELSVFVWEPAREGWNYGEDLWKQR